MTLSPEWIFGTILTIMLAVIGYLFKRISDVEASADKRIDAVLSIVDGVKQDYVRRDDNTGTISRIEKAVDSVQNDIKALTLLVIEAVRPKPRSGG